MLCQKAAYRRCRVAVFALVPQVSRISRNLRQATPVPSQSADCRKGHRPINRSPLALSRATVGLHHSTTADPGNSGILGRSERYYRPGSGSHRYIPVNPLLVSLTTKNPAGLPESLATYSAVCGYWLEGQQPPNSVGDSPHHLASKDAHPVADLSGAQPAGTTADFTGATPSPRNSS